VEAFRHRQGLRRPFVLHVGTLQPRKNLPALIDAFAALGRDDVDLVLVGGKGWLYQEIFDRVRQLGLTGRVRFTGYVPDADLPLWYNAATVLVFPSVHEGFGMPITQAMASGTPVVAAAASAIPEAAGGAALLFEPQDGAGLRDHLAQVLDERSTWARMSSDGLARASEFSWERAGRQLEEVYHKALSPS
jgi:glycosyltransferase involved in cell wall biosynthesis